MTTHDRVSRTLRSLLRMLPFCGLVLPLVFTDVGRATEQRRRRPPRVVEPRAGSFDAQLLMRQVARNYFGWGRVDDELRWAPFLCRMPFPSQARMSRPSDATPHGRKVYFVYAHDRLAYMRATSAAGGSSPVGQIVVKEAFIPRALSEIEGRAFPSDHPAPPSTDPFDYRGVTEANQRFGTGARAGIYVLAKVGAAAGRATDRGWIYGTVTPDGAVTSSGRVTSCMGCHLDAPHDRLFGLDQQ